MKLNKCGLNPAVLFALQFVCLFVSLYGFYMAYLGITGPGGLYIAFLDEHFNFISGLRHILIESGAAILNMLGYRTRTNAYQLLVAGHNILHIGFDCLGFGVMCFFTAFVVAYSGSFKSKLSFWAAGIVTIQLLNILRFVLLALYWKRNKNVYMSDHHTIFNIVVYIIIAISLYFYTRYQDKATTLNAAN
ncbi:exosortase Y [Mucilaginibacter lutimaris]|uniref:Exosortase Y n=1 Tax=Mucilaginibacter lutimaris TaxID=931629 RepID=A0ABW2ZGZ0_9SPHI